MILVFNTVKIKKKRGLIIVPVGTMDLFYLRITLSKLQRGLWTMSKIESLARARTSPSEVHPGGKF